MDKFIYIFIYIFIDLESFNMKNYFIYIICIYSYTKHPILTASDKYLKKYIRYKKMF